MSKRLGVLAAVFTTGVLAAGCSPSGVFGAGANSAPGNKILMAKLGGLEGGAQGYVAFDEGEHDEFTVEITGGEPGATLQVSINGDLVLSITLDEFGNAHLQFDSNADDSWELPLPSDFPLAGEGDEVEVGDLSGNLQEEEETDDIDDDDDADGDDDDTDDADDDEADHDDDGNANDNDDGDVDDADDEQTEDNDNTIGPASGRDET